MRRLILGTLAGVMMAGAAWAQEVLEPEPAIRDTIQSQLDAFMADDFGAAFEFAAPNIRQMFRTPETFGAMVQQGYPMVWRPGAVEYGDLREIEGLLWQRVLVTDKTGRQFVLEYQMQDVLGDWRIAGVRVVPAPSVSA
ncbi:DUF4864 domain-containing protein [Ponticoccus alexandrii]|uniref:DUF4864 domain-containing protein n=1 Tax=Ponticoccus alexandrii TaxID=1943633 RepID=A0ABX7F4W8_9RHOB|nr:DUF4864 domain-containing protein [Ponticoccus alexandrii]QRF65342.1 DUF4864 domain-containing protein [Ponticoccus alexandrii]